MEFRKPPSSGLLIVGLLIAFVPIYALYSGKIFLMSRAMYRLVIDRRQSPEEFAIWLYSLSIVSAALCTFAFVKLGKLEERVLAVASRVKRKRDAINETMFSQSPPIWAYVFWGIAILLTALLLVFGHRLEK